MTDKKKLVHPEVPLTRAWQTGRRLYVRCPRDSQLDQGMRSIGARWDSEAKARWVGSTKRQKVVDLLLADLDRQQRIADIKKLGLWVAIPQEAFTIRTRIRKLHGVYEGEPRYQWAMPTEEAYNEVKGLVAQWHADRTAEEKAAKAQANTAKAQAAEAEAKAEADAEQAAAKQAARRREKLIEESGRTPTGETAWHREYSTVVMYRETAVRGAHQLGTVLQLDDARRGLVVASTVRFLSWDMASSACGGHNGIDRDRAHWCYRYELLVVEPTDEERADDDAKQALVVDGEEIHSLMQSAGEVTEARAADWTHVPDTEIAGIITASAGTGLQFRAGSLILTVDGRVIWQHPGYYDEYVRTEGVSDAPELVTRVRTIIAAGNRTRTALLGGQLPIHYQVTTVHYGDAVDRSDAVERR